MKRLYTTGVVTCLPGVGAPSPSQTAWGRAHRAIEAGYLGLLSAVVAEEPELIPTLLTPEFLWHRPDGSPVDEMHFGAALSRKLEPLVGMHLTGSILMLNLRGDEAEVTFREEIRGLAHGPDGKSRLVSLVDEYRDLWKLTEAGWQLHRRTPLPAGPLA